MVSLGGIVWNLITWWKGLPSSSSHALIGGLCGAALAAAHNDWAALIWSEAVGDWTKNKGILWKVVVPMISSPVAGFTLGILIMGTFMAVISTTLTLPGGAPGVGHIALTTKRFLVTERAGVLKHFAAPLDRGAALRDIPGGG